MTDGGSGRVTSEGMSPELHRASPDILDRRTLEQNHRALVPLLKPGFSVLDIGCGTGAITAGIVPRVSPGGFVLGIDRDEDLIERARRNYASLADLASSKQTSSTFPPRRCWKRVARPRSTW